MLVGCDFCFFFFNGRFHDHEVRQIEKTTEFSDSYTLCFSQRTLRIIDICDKL